MGVLKALMRFISYVFHGLLALGLLSLSIVALAAGAPVLHMDMLPWTTPTTLLCAALAGLAILLLALRGWLRWLFFLWSLAVVVLVVRGYFLGGYHFSPGEINTALYVLAGSIVALPGAWFVMTRRPAR
jgi:hypothetical protein